MRVNYEDGKWIATCAITERDRLKEAGFIFDTLGTRKWYTSDWRKASVFLEHCVGEAYDILNEIVTKHENELNASYAMYAEADIARPHLVNHKGEVLDYLPYQKAGILYAADRLDTLIADSPGLGKTIQAIGLINYLGIKTGVIVCPSTLKLNWLKEMVKWMVDKTLTIGVAYGSEIPDTDFVIINYDILARNKEVLWAEHWGILVCDEAQYLSNGESKRTQAIFGEYKMDWNTKKTVRKKQRIKDRWSRKIEMIACLRSERRLMLSGTPMMKRPSDLWSIIRDFDPRGLGKDWYEYAMEYCAGFENSFGLDASGGSNLDDLNERLRKTFMIRRLKSNVLKDLPEKTREIIIFPPEGMKKMIKTERDKFTDALAMLGAANTGIEYKPKLVLADLDPALVLDTMTTILKDFDREGLNDLDGGEIEPGFAAYSEARHDLALSKVPMAIEHISRLVESGEKVIVFAIHKDVIAEMFKAFPTAARIIGGMTTKKVEADKLRFQGDKDKGIEPDPECRVMLANLKAGGVGHTLTEATIVVFVEMWSVPGDMEQCEDRAHRIGLEHNVLIQYLVVDGTMDAMTIQTLIIRIEMIQQAVDGTEPELRMG
jgi:SWI/SNF-related matrix-associated actin-dependent regulator 1 of chromatin subfamily A